MAKNSEIKIYYADHLWAGQGEIHSPGALAVQGSRILGVGEPDPLQAQFPSAVLEHFEGQTLLPGLVDAHCDVSVTHFAETPQGPVRGPDGHFLFTPWLIYLSRYKAGLKIPDQQKAIRTGLQTLKKSGVTALGDHCRFPVALSLYKESGLRVTCLAEVENIRRPSAQEEFEQALALIDEIQHETHPLITSGLSPFSAYTLSKNLLKILTDHCLQQKIPMHLRAALTFSEMEFFYDSQGEISSILFKEAGWEDLLPLPHRMTPIQYLHEIGFLRTRPALIGCLHLGPTDEALLEHAGCLRIFAPQAFQFLELGEVPWEKIISGKNPWALATLGRAWGSNLNLWDEMRTVLYEAPEESRAKYATQILGAATLGGAQALHLQERIGSLIPGKQADFIVVSTPQGDESLEAGLIDQTQAAGVSFVAGNRIL